MRVLLDTCTFVWLISSPDSVPATTRAVLERETEAIIVSAASVWELAIKRKLGKLGELASIALDLSAFVREAMGTYLFEELPMTMAHAALAGDLPLHHRDAFDRMLAAQARIEDLILISPDRKFDRYEVARRWD